MNEFDYPAEARAALLDCYDKLMADEKASAAVKKHIDLYSMGADRSHNAMLAEMTELAIQVGTPWQTAHLLICILLSKHLVEIYEEKNIPEDIRRDTLLDMKWKLFECQSVYHVWGTFVAHWYEQFFTLKIFAVGRLQYQMCPFGRSYYGEEIGLTPDMKALYIHIPSCGPLTKELREDSYDRAKEFFADYFGKDPALFVCSSWLLYPGHKEMLPEHSNVLDFMNDFTVFECNETDRSNDLWRIFGDAYVLPYDVLPRNNSMRRAYAKRLCEGKKVGRGVGFFLR